MRGGMDVGVIVTHGNPPGAAEKKKVSTKNVSETQPTSEIEQYLKQASISSDQIKDLLTRLKSVTLDKLKGLDHGRLVSMGIGGIALKISRLNKFWKNQEVLKALAIKEDYENFSKKFQEMIVNVDIRFSQLSIEERKKIVINILKPYTSDLKFSDLSVSIAGRPALGGYPSGIPNVLEYNGLRYNEDNHIIKIEIVSINGLHFIIKEWYKSIRAWNFGLSPEPIFLYIIKDGEQIFVFMSFQKMIDWEMCKRMYRDGGECEKQKGDLIERMNRIVATKDPEMVHPDLHDGNIVFEQESGFLYAYLIDWGPII